MERNNYQARMHDIIKKNVAFRIHMICIIKSGNSHPI